MRGMHQQSHQKLAEARGRELRIICERVSFYSEFHVDSELRLQQQQNSSNDFNRAFGAQQPSASARNSRLCCCCSPPWCERLRRALEGRLDSELLRSEQCTLKILQIALCLLSLLLCPFISGMYGERGICLALSAGALLAIVSILAVKLATLNRWLTPQHWFIVEASVYALLCLLFCLCALAMALLNVHRHLVTHKMPPDFGQQQQQSLALVESLVLALCAGTFAVDVGCVYSQRLSRTWIPFVSKYRI